MDWLRAWGVPFIRLNGSDIDTSHGPFLSISSKDLSIRLNLDRASIAPEAIKVVWYRRWAYNNKYRKGQLFKAPSYHKDGNIYAIYSHIYRELEGLSKFLFSSLKSATWLGDPNNSVPNKLEVLKLAAELGLDIPDTIVTTDPDEVRRFAGKHGQIITKTLSDVLMCIFDERLAGSYTSVVPDEFLNGSTWFGSFPSLFQEKLDKRYEIRIFYLDGKCYSMAMFTQNNAQTQIDFRKYCYAHPSRSIPYRLPEAIESKLCALMKALHYDTGSIDMVRTQDGRYVFLEINPVGQFGMVSSPCNYYLERKVAEYLADRLNRAEARDAS